MIVKMIKILSGCEKAEKPHSADLRMLEQNPERHVLYKLSKDAAAEYRRRMMFSKVKRALIEEAYAELQARVAAKNNLESIHV